MRLQGILLIVLVAVGCMGKSPPQFSHQQVRENLVTRIAQVKGLMDETPALEARLEALKKEVPAERRPTPEQVQAQEPDDYERRFGLGYPYELDWHLYSPAEQKELRQLQTDLDRLGQESERFFQLEAELKVWEQAKQP
ncbi:MAG: hypothetical protein AB7S38_36350 [Vulcanimicrobiota bacterium]